VGKHRYGVIAVGLLGSCVFIALAVRHLDVDAVKRAWGDAHVLPWLPVGIASYLLGHVVRGVRCRLLVRREATIRLITASNIVVVGYASNNVLPARLGELVRAGMLAERTGMPIAQSLAVTFIERVLDGLAIVLLLVIGTLGGDTPGWIHSVMEVAVVVFGVATLALIAGASSSTAILAVASRLGSKLGPRMHDRLVSLASSIVNAAACLRNPKDAGLLACYSLLVWSLEAGLFVALLPIFGLQMSLINAVVAMSVTNLGLLVPSSPGFIGPFHYFCSRALMAHGVDESIAVAYATLVHLAFYVPVTIWGAAAMLWYGVEVGSTAAIARQARVAGKLTTVRGVPVVEIAPVQTWAVEPPTSAFTIGLVEAIVGSSHHAAALTYAASFVDGQIASLPTRLRAMFGGGMTLFRFVTRLRFLRGYCDVPLEARRAWTKRWAEGRIALVRQLFKPVRAIALLAYYDHADVKRDLLAGGIDVSAGRLVRDVRATAETT
jgi:uncharacterized protein (TIRG00374 family)